MGEFSGYCVRCEEPVNQEELCVLIHQRHGVEIGRAVGHYAGFGNVEEDKVFRSNKIAGPNSHDEICLSSFDLEDSESFEPKSGVTYCHKVCYEKFAEEDLVNLPISLPDEEQGWGEPNPKYM